MSTSEYSEQLETYLKKYNIKNFEYSQCSDIKRIGKGGYAVVYSASFEGQMYALKSLDINLSFEEKEFKVFKRELECLYKVDHSNIIKFHGISRNELDKLSTETVDFIINNIDIGQFQSSKSDEINSKQTSEPDENLIKINESDVINSEQTNSDEVNSKQTSEPVENLIKINEPDVINSEQTNFDEVNSKQTSESDENLKKINGPNVINSEQTSSDEINSKQTSEPDENLIKSNEPDEINVKHKNDTDYEPKLEDHINSSAKTSKYNSISNLSKNTKYSKWLEEALKDGTIAFYEYSEFKNVKVIEKGVFGDICSADFYTTKLALKCFGTNEPTKEFVNELRQLRTVSFHPNTNQFHGITI
ncbi:10239_t:CDS:2, partial [Scutellospora calospora]